MSDSRANLKTTANSKHNVKKVDEKWNIRDLLFQFEPTAKSGCDMQAIKILVDDQAAVLDKTVRTSKL